MSAVQIAEDLEKGVSVVGQIASGAVDVLPWIGLVAGIFPGVGSVISALQLAAPILRKIATAAPIATQAIEAGMTVAQAVDKSGPTMLGHIKELYAVFANADPSSDASGTTAADVSDADAYKFAGNVLFGRPWTDAETQRYWDKATGGGW